MALRIRSALASAAILIGIAAGPSQADNARAFALSAPSVQATAAGVRLRGSVCRAKASATRFAPILTLVGSDGARTEVPLIGDGRGSGCSYYDMTRSDPHAGRLQMCVAASTTSTAPYCRPVDLY